MQLKFDRSNPAFEKRLDKQFGISETRIEFLFDAMENIYNKLKVGVDGVKHLGDAYVEIAKICNNPEEYTVCLHVFIFKCARTGNLRSELEAN